VTLSAPTAPGRHPAPSPELAALRRPGPTVPESEIPELVELGRLASEIEALAREHAEVFERYRVLVEKYNAELELAEKIVRARGVSSGPFVNTSVSLLYDAKTLCNMLGREVFRSVGGTITTRQVYEVDRDELERAIARGLVPTEHLGAFITAVRNYKKPEKLSAP
jgi:hypothetical protein